jgi:hypothetical protein
MYHASWCYIFLDDTFESSIFHTRGGQAQRKKMHRIVIEGAPVQYLFVIYAKEKTARGLDIEKQEEP